MGEAFLRMTVLLFVRWKATQNPIAQTRFCFLISHVLSQRSRNSHKLSGSFAQERRSSCGQFGRAILHLTGVLIGSNSRVGRFSIYEFAPEEMERWEKKGRNWRRGEECCIFSGAPWWANLVKYRALCGAIPVECVVIQLLQGCAVDYCQLCL